jgi:hypothetical protein
MNGEEYSSYNAKHTLLVIISYMTRLKGPLLPSLVTRALTHTNRINPQIPEAQFSCDRNRISNVGGNFCNGI